MTYKQLNKEQREVIQILINKKENFTTIGNSINVDRTTISKEIRRNRYIKSNYYEPFDFNGINMILMVLTKLRMIVKYYNIHLMFAILVL